MYESRYQGWANYPTWVVTLWLSNDEGLYNEARDLVESVLDVAPSTRMYTRRADVADALRSWVCDDLAPDLGATFASDLLVYALSEVDWFEIAAAWMGEEDGDES